MYEKKKHLTRPKTASLPPPVLSFLALTPFLCLTSYPHPLTFIFIRFLLSLTPRGCEVECSDIASLDP